MTSKNKNVATNTKATLPSTQKATEKPNQVKPASAPKAVKEPTREQQPAKVKSAKVKPARRQRPASAPKAVKEPAREQQPAKVKSAKAKPARRQRPASAPKAVKEPAREQQPAKVKSAKAKSAKAKPARRQRPASAPKAVKEPARTKEEARSEFEEAWEEYNTALDNWKDAIAWWYDATNRSLRTYRVACQRALETDAEALKKVSARWHDTWDVIGPTYIKQQTNMIEDIFGNTNIKTINKFNEQWEKFLKTSGSDSITAYQEAIRRFNQTWAMS